MEKCKNCKFWIIADDDIEDVTYPVDPDTYERMEIPYVVKRCTSPKVVFYEFPPDKDCATVIDASHYHAGLYTAEDFGCINHIKIDN